MALAVSTLPIAQRNGMSSLLQSWHCSFASRNIPEINNDPAGATIWRIEQAIVVGGVVFTMVLLALLIAAQPQKGGSADVS